MTWKPAKPEQSGLGFGESPMDWTPTPKPVVVKAKDKIGTFARTISPQRQSQRWSKVDAPSDPWGQIARMRELKMRVQSRVMGGESYEDALVAVKRELWPDEYRSEREP